MKKKLLVMVMALATLFTSFTMNAILVPAEETSSPEDSLRAWFDFRDESYFRDDAYFELKQLEAMESGVVLEDFIFAIYQNHVQVADGLNNKALMFRGTANEYVAEENIFLSESSVIIKSPFNLLEGDNVTINVVYGEGESEEIQPLFSAGVAGSNYALLASSWKTQNAGPSMCLSTEEKGQQTIIGDVKKIPEPLTWNMLTYVQEGNIGKIYLNGELISQDTLQSKLEDINCEFPGQEGYFLYTLGSITMMSSTGLYGGIDDFRIYGFALTQEEIQALATSLNIEVDTDDSSNDEENETPDATTPTDGVVIDWNFSNADSVKDVVLGNGVTIENGKATFAPGNEGIALPDDIFKDAETVTVEMTLQPSAFANYRALLCGGNQNGKWFVMGVMEDGSVRYAIATNGDDASETKGNSTSGSQGNAHASYQSGAVLTTDAEHTVKYVITQAETNVYIDGELALTLPTPDKDAIGEIGGPVVLGKATKWPDSSYEGTISSLKITVEKAGEDSSEGTGEGEGSGDENNSGNQGGADDSTDNKPTTGDVAMIATLLTAGVAALGGLKLRKKMK